MARDEDEISSSDDSGTASNNGDTEKLGTAGFDDKYDCKEVLGRGMSSTVRRCVERGTGKEFAVKILDVTTEKMTQQQADELRKATLSEIDTLRMVAGHKNIIELHDFYSTATFLFIVFELAPGGELFDYMTEVVTLSEKKTRHIMRQLFHAVDCLHSKRIVHRDLKPENILMISDDTIKLTDFGFALNINDLKVPLKELCGTPGYLAPEMLRASMYEEAPGYGLEVDLWACGVIMYTLLAGYAPFFHRKQIYMLRAISEGKYEFRSPEWDEISTSAKDLISHLLVVDPGLRYDARQALAHPFLMQIGMAEEAPFQPKFDARKRFKINPYSQRKIRKQIELVAFRVYAHWVKKGREQYRDVLFANALQTEIDRSKSSLV